MAEPGCSPVVCLSPFPHGKRFAKHHDGLLKAGWEMWESKQFPGGFKGSIFEQLDVILPLHAKHYPGRSLLILRQDLEINERLAEPLEGLILAEESPTALTLLSNCCPTLNPFAGMEIPQGLEAHLSANGGGDALVSLLGSGQLHASPRWPSHFLLLSAAAIEVLVEAKPSTSNALSLLRDRGGDLLVPDWLFLSDPTAAVALSLKLEPHESPRPPAWGGLNARLQSWLTAEGIAAASRAPAGAGVTLHITHSWGGGIARWVESFIAADHGNDHYQLRSEGPQSGQGAGQRLALYKGNYIDQPIATWWLQAPIQSVVPAHQQYAAIVQEIRQRYGIGRVMVSSLVGHSMDALRLGLPSVQVLHDFFPLWPILGANPEPYLAADGGVDLHTALTDNRKDLLFIDRSAESWQGLADTWRKTLTDQNVQIVAPSQSVIDMMGRLSPAWRSVPVELIPHGLPPWPQTIAVGSVDRDDTKLRIVVPGRIQAGKGQALLLEALPELSKHARICLLGSGKSGEVFFGRAGVDVIIEYQRDDLPRILQGIAPHAAAILSTVPETFSYTLSEMHELGVPVIATRVGSLAERVEDDSTGWLIGASAEELVAKVKQLRASPEKIARVRKKLASIKQLSIGEMLNRYDECCAPALDRGDELPISPPVHSRHGALEYEKSRLEQRLAALEYDVGQLEAVVEQRTSWAEDRDRALKQGVNALQSQLDERFEELTAAREAFVSAEDGRLLAESEWVNEQVRHQRSTRQLGNLDDQHRAVLASSSWRLTRPLRVARRMLQNFNRARGWNPLKWPLLLAQLVRTLATLGLKESLIRFQQGQDNQPQERVAAIMTGAVADRLDDPVPPGDFPQHESPLVSIVILAYNQWNFTAACLRSLVSAGTIATFEVIVVDDCSSDETAERLHSIAGLTTVTNNANRGFIQSCNRGAKKAQGKYLVLLNNDTQVLDGWLDELLSTFQRFPDTGMAGARLIYPDGRLQEAGGIVFQDGTGWNYGRLDDADRPRFQFTREVDYCSGACIMIEAATFDQLGGFDSRYEPAYYEDTDLAFRLREIGLKVRVNPAATIIHHEGISSGTDINSGIKQFQATNAEIFRQRWASSLLTYPEPISDPEDADAVRRARDHRCAGTILVIDAYTPEPDQDSGSLRLVYLFDCLVDLGYRVTFLPDNKAYAGRYTQDLQSAGVEVVSGEWLGSLHSFFSKRGHEFEFVMISRHYVANNYVTLLRRYCQQARFIFDTVDLHYLREQRLADLEDSLPLKRVAAQTRRSELAVIAAADLTLVVSPVEQSVLQADAPEARVHVLSNIHKPVAAAVGFHDRKDIFFVGGYQHPPNIDAALWFVNQVWPLIQGQIPDIKFHLIGSKAPQRISALNGNGVVFHGHVPDLGPWLDGCRLSVAPLRYGAGVKGKVNISMSHGQPVVATTAGAEGIHAHAGEDIMVADNPDEFAKAVVQLYRDEALWNRISSQGLENVRRYFSIQTARENLASMLNELRQEGSRR